MSDPTMQGTPPGVAAERYSLAEIYAHCRKAARGAGCPWGMAEEAGKAARWLAAGGLAGPEALAQLLSERTGCCCAETSPCALRLGTQISDQGGEAGPDAPLLTRAIVELHNAAIPPASFESRPVDPTAWAILDRLAARTYVPATEASRRAGAGAGTNDND